MSKKLQCFVSASASTNTGTLRTILKNMSIDVYDSYDFVVGEKIYDLLRKRIKSSDFAIFVISEKNSHVFYELGLCEGLNKPLFIIVGKDVEPPYFVQKYIYLRTDLDNSELLRLSLTRFVKELESRRIKPRIKQRESDFSTLTSEAVDHYLDKIKSLRVTGSAIEVEQIVSSLFSQMNLQIESNPSSNSDRGVDFAIWDDDLNFVMGNPLLIEVKYGSLNADGIKEAETRLKEYISDTEAKAAILLYLDKNGKHFLDEYSYKPLILRYDLEEFIKELAKARFVDVVLSKRNKMVHGIN